MTLRQLPLPPAALLQPLHWVVIVPVANMYSSATADTDVVSQAILGSNVAVLEKRQSGSRFARTINTPAGCHFEICASRARHYAAPGHIVQVESLFANLYRETDVTQHRPLITLPFETQLEDSCRARQ